jgi:hypothetical protein
VINEGGALSARRYQRRIALLKPEIVRDERVLHAMQLFGSMLWAFKGSTRSEWLTTGPQEADVIVVHPGHQDERIAKWRASGKQILAIALDADAAANEPYALVYPFRAAQALRLLERLDSELRRMSGHPDSPEDYACAPDWKTVQTLRRLRSQPNGRWFVALDAGAEILWLSSNAVHYFADAAVVQSIRAGGLRMSEITLRECSAPPNGLDLRHGNELAWFVGYHASTQLAPWLDPLARYRIKRWPNFNAIRPSAAQIRIATALVAAETDFTEIVSRVDVCREEIVRTLNALSTCDVLTVGQSRAVTTFAAPDVEREGRGRLGALLRNVRRHLGLRA